jgi:cytoskeletal protein CcmA (bactofilin family)
VQGNIRLPAARVCVGPQGSVKADIEAREIVIEGMAHGTLKAAENIHLGASSRVQGTVLAPRIGIEDGARLSGKVDMTRTGSSPDLSASGTSPDSGLSRSASAGVKV